MNDDMPDQEMTRLQALREGVTDTVRPAVHLVGDGLDAYWDAMKVRPIVTILATIGAIYVGHTWLTQKSRFMENCMEDASRSQCEREWDHYREETDPGNYAR